MGAENIRKGGAPGRRKFIDRELFGGLNRAGPGRRLGQVLKNKRPCSGPLTGKGREIGVCAQQFRSHGGPVTNTIQVGQTVLDLVELKWHRQQMHCIIYLGFAQSGAHNSTSASWLRFLHITSK